MIRPRKKVSGNAAERPPAPAPRPRESLFKSAFVFLFGAAILIGGLFGFGGKIYKFILAWSGNPDAQFALIPVAMYFAVAFGFACIFVWAVLNGMLRDIEGPKHWMLQNERELEELERLEKERAKTWA